jgi:FkbM family methyltransferase
MLPSNTRLPVRYTYLKLLRKLDPEMKFALTKLKGKRRFVDVGANVGIYSYYFSKYFQFVESFEPIGEVSYRLSSLENPSIRIHPIALSENSGAAYLHIPVNSDGLMPTLASLEKRAGAVNRREIPIATLDSFNFVDVDLIKIDVEGHELKVLSGAMKTIQKSRPVLICEIEQRHSSSPIGEIFESVLGLGYKGFFLSKGKAYELSSFSYETHQLPYLNDVMNGNYINNFVFVPLKD